MRYSQYKAFEKHLASSFPSNYSSLYCIVAKNSSERTLVLNEIKKKSRPVSTSIISIDTPTFENQLMSILDSFSFFSGLQVVNIQASEKISKQHQAFLEKKLSSIPNNIIIVLTLESILKTTNFYKTIEKHGVILDMTDEKPWEKEKNMAEWILEQASINQKTIEKEAVNILARGVQSNFAQLHSEWEKLLVFTLPKNHISCRDIYEICCLTSNDSIWQLGESVLSFNIKGAVEATFRSFDQGLSIFSLLRSLRHQLSSALVLVSEPREIIAKKLPHLKGGLLEKQMQIALKFGSDRLINALIALDELEFISKDSIDDPKIIFTIFLNKVFI